ncbi:MAG: GTP-binding protein, partial [Desulfobacterales bacterium]
MTEKMNQLRNIVMAGHGSSGKTSVAEAMLYNSGVIQRLGRVEDGNTAMDFEPEELKRQLSLATAFHQFTWEKHTVSFMDTPGFQDFFSDTKICMQAAD